MEAFHLKIPKDLSFIVCSFTACSSRKCGLGTKSVPGAVLDLGEETCAGVEGGGLREHERHPQGVYGLVRWDQAVRL